MSTPRFHRDAALAEGVEVPATPEQAHHLGAVLRRGPGDAVRLFNARDGEFAATLSALRRDRAAFAVGARLRPPAAEPELRLLLAAVKRDVMDRAVEKAGELGVTLIQPVLTARTIAPHANTARLAAIARSAAEQCDRLGVPAVRDAAPLHAVLDAWTGGTLVAGDESLASPPIARVVPTLAGPFGWLVGPEGGFTPAELDDLRRRPFVATVALGPRILRVDTAAIAGLAVLQALAGDWAGAA